MKTVLHVLSMNWFSGAENVAITLIRGFHERNLPYHFIYASPAGPIKETVEENGIEFRSIDSVSLIEIKRLINEVKPDIIHAHDRTASVVCAIASGGVPVISQLHNNSPWMKKINAKTLLYGLSCIKYKKILGVSHSVFSEFIFNWFIRDKEIVVGNPVDTSRVRELAQKEDSEGKYDVCSLGRLTPPKNPLLFLDAMRLLCNRKRDLKIAMIGDGEMRKEVEQKIEQLHLSNNIFLLGFQKNPYPYLFKSRVLCITSKWEGFGLAAVEALALGKPVVSSNVGGLSDIITDNCGVFCKTEKEFSDAIYNLLDDDHCYQKMSEGALERASELDNMDLYVELIDSIYTELR